MYTEYLTFLQTLRECNLSHTVDTVENQQKCKHSKREKEKEQKREREKESGSPCEARTSRCCAP